MSELTPEMLARMTSEEKANLARHMFNPIRCGGMGYDADGNPMYVLGGKSRTPQEHDDIVRRMNPLWSDEALRKTRALLCDEDGICRYGERLRARCQTSK